MAVTVKKVSIWRTEVEDRPGTLARVLEPLAGAGADLKVVMGYRYPGEGSRAAIEVYPVSGKKLTAAAQSAGLSPVSIPTLLVEGDDRPGLGQKLSAALGDGGINISYVVAQVVGRKFSAVYGFPAGTDAARASALIKKAAAPPPKPAKRKKPAKSKKK